MTASRHQVDPRLDLVLERILQVPRELVWKAWTTPDLLKKWFCPAPWSVTECDQDLRPGGVFRTVMRSPEGQEFPNLGCFLEVVPYERLVWTDALLPGFRPVAAPQSGAGLLFTAVIELESMGRGTAYRAIAMHKDEADRIRHEEMGFHQGWGICADQLVEQVKGMRAAFQ